MYNTFLIILFDTGRRFAPCTRFPGRDVGVLGYPRPAVVPGDDHGIGGHERLLLRFRPPMPTVCNPPGCCYNRIFVTGDYRSSYSDVSSRRPGTAVATTSRVRLGCQVVLSVSHVPSHLDWPGVSSVPLGKTGASRACATGRPSYSDSRPSSTRHALRFEHPVAPRTTLRTPPRRGCPP